MAARPDPNGVRIAELVGTLSYAADLGLGQPMEHCMRRTVIALRLADLAGADESERQATFYLGLLMNAYCHADAAEQAKWFGDEITLKGDVVQLLDMNTAQAIALLLRRVGSHGSGMDRARRLAAFPISGVRQMMTFADTHTALGAQFATRIGLGESVATAIRQAYEQWDGRGQPDHLRGTEICLPARIVQIAGPVEVFSRRRDIDAACRVVKRHRGTEFDGALVDLVVDNAQTIMADLDQAADWDAVLDAEPQLSRSVADAELDEVLEAMADLVDVKSPYLSGHSRGVSNLAAAAARASGMSAADITAIRRAGLIHDLGRLGVSNAIWDRPAALSKSDVERVRLHPYLTDRMLVRVAALDRCREIASRHHERLDGSGYPRGLTASTLTPADRLLAAADVYHAMTEPRPHRPPLPTDRAVAELRAEARAGRLDGDAVAMVLTAAGQRAPARREWPGGLTAREVEVLRLVARGHSTKQVAQRLSVTPKTAANHIEHIYTKLGISSRAAAALYASQHGLTGHFESA
ncbi:MAG TPA: HD domain-containing phosphohydrolase [Micromonosporaceae bacterium]|nr:HD domain-containing phosphohydrolase [Micromonosporaceae bacterium]